MLACLAPTYTFPKLSIYHLMPSAVLFYDMYKVVARIAPYPADGKYRRGRLCFANGSLKVRKRLAKYSLTVR